MSGNLDASTREALLREAERIRASLEQKAAAEAATALAILLAEGTRGLEQALDPSIPVELGAETQHWLTFRGAVAPSVFSITRHHGQVGAALFLGWLKRLAKLPDRHGAPPSPRARSNRAARMAAPGLSAGQLVEAILLEERTKRGGWKARHTPSGLTGHIQNSAAVPAAAKAGDRVMLVVASVGSREIAFRVPDAAPNARSENERRGR